MSTARTKEVTEQKRTTAAWKLVTQLFTSGPVAPAVREIAPKKRARRTIEVAPVNAVQQPAVISEARTVSPVDSLALSLKERPFWDKLETKLAVTKHEVSLPPVEWLTLVKNEQAFWKNISGLDLEKLATLRSRIHSLQIVLKVLLNYFEFPSISHKAPQINYLEKFSQINQALSQEGLAPFTDILFADEFHKVLSPGELEKNVSILKSYETYIAYLLNLVEEYLEEGYKDISAILAITIRLMPQVEKEREKKLYPVTVFRAHLGRNARIESPTRKIEVNQYAQKFAPQIKNLFTPYVNELKNIDWSKPKDVRKQRELIASIADIINTVLLQLEKDGKNAEYLRFVISRAILDFDAQNWPESKIVLRQIVSRIKNVQLRKSFGNLGRTNILNLRSYRPISELEQENE